MKILAISGSLRRQSFNTAILQAVMELAPADRSNNSDALFTETEIEITTPEPRDLLIRVQAISVNPIDSKVRSSPQRQHPSVGLMA